MQAMADGTIDEGEVLLLSQVSSYVVVVWLRGCVVTPRATAACDNDLTAAHNFALTASLFLLFSTGLPQSREKFGITEEQHAEIMRDAHEGFEATPWYFVRLLTLFKIAIQFMQIFGMTTTVYVRTARPCIAHRGKRKVVVRVFAAAPCGAL